MESANRGMKTYVQLFIIMLSWNLLNSLLYILCQIIIIKLMLTNETRNIEILASFVLIPFHFHIFLGKFMTLDSFEAAIHFSCFIVCKIMIVIMPKFCSSLFSFYSEFKSNDSKFYCHSALFLSRLSLL